MSSLSVLTADTSIDASPVVAVIDVVVVIVVIVVVVAEVVKRKKTSSRKSETFTDTKKLQKERLFIGCLITINPFKAALLENLRFKC